jgi:nitrite reductase/ring-hydroxylating ferredoxin subunit
VERVEVASLEQLAETDRLVVTVGEHQILLVRSHGAIVAIENRCPHQGTPLDTATVSGRRIRCRAHGWTFDLFTGGQLRPLVDCLLRPDDRAWLTQYPVVIEDGRVFIEHPLPLGEGRGEGAALDA